MPSGLYVLSNTRKRRDLKRLTWVTHYLWLNLTELFEKLIKIGSHLDEQSHNLSVLYGRLDILLMDFPFVTVKLILNHFKSPFFESDYNLDVYFNWKRQFLKISTIFAVTNLVEKFNLGKNFPLQNFGARLFIDEKFG